jgi:hypothetical protein
MVCIFLVLNDPRPFNEYYFYHKASKFFFNMIN